MVDVCLSMVGIDLCTDFLFPARYHGVGQAGDEYSIVIQVRDEVPRFLSIPDHERDDWMLAGYGLDPQPHKPFFETPGKGPKLLQQRKTFGTIYDFDRA